VHALINRMRVVVNHWPCPHTSSGLPPRLSTTKRYHSD